MRFEENALFLSFSVPVYNVEKYVAECLDSLLDQDISYEDYEIICAKDGFNDGNLEILRQYEEKYVNIRVIDKESGGTTARNAGLDAAGAIISGLLIRMISSDAAFW